MASDLSRTLEKLSIKEDALRSVLTILSSLGDNIKDTLAENETIKKKIESIVTHTTRQSAAGIMFENFLKTHFKRLGVDYKAFSSIFENDNVYLTGSIILMGLVGDLWVSDIDIVVANSSFASVRKILVNMGFVFESIPTARRGISEYFGKVFNSDLFCKTNLWKGVCGSIKVDLIVMKKGESPIELINAFDFRFCRNYWDGKMVYCLDHWSVRHKKHQITNKDMPKKKYLVLENPEYHESRAKKISRQRV